jgi:MFS family permease
MLTLKQDGGYFRQLISVGSFLVVFGHMMLSLCHEYWQVLLAQGFCIGLGFACLFVPSVAILSTYFTTKIAAATGLAASGSSLGGVLYPIILNQLIPQVGFPWAVRTIGFICLGTLLVPNLVMKVRVLPPARRALIDPSAFKHPAFIVFCLASFTTFLGLFQPFFFVQDFAIIEKVTTEKIAFYLLSMLNATSIFGRILPNILADKIGPLNVIVPCAVITGILILCLIAVKHLGGILAFVLLFGFFSGSLVSLPPTVVVHLTKDRRFIGTRMGMCFAFTGFAALVSTPIGGALIKVHNDFWPTWVFGGVLAVTGGTLMGVSRIIHKGPGLTTKA